MHNINGILKEVYYYGVEQTKVLRWSIETYCKQKRKIGMSFVCEYVNIVNNIAYVITRGELC